MPGIQVLDEQTIDKIAAGEVVERPSSVVKELVENAIDAKATAITVEIKDGGISFIRITDNGQGIPKSQVPTAFLRHATSKIQSVEDLLTVSSLGFRGEALSSIAAVSQVELITKTPSELTGTKYVIEGSKEKSVEDIGAPDGTTFLVRNLFYNTPARQKFLKSAQTEASYISTLMERLALSHPGISFQFIVNNQPKIHTNGNTQAKDIIYHIFGRDIAAGVLPVQYRHALFSVEGYVGKPFISRGNRNFEMYFINGRYIKSALISKSIEDAYKPFLMKHQYPFTVLMITMDSELIDVNVHPAKMEIRFRQSEEIYQALTAAVRAAVEHKDLIPEVPAAEEKAARQEAKPALKRQPEPFEKKRLEAAAKSVQKDSPYERKYRQLQQGSSTHPTNNMDGQVQQGSSVSVPTADGGHGQIPQRSNAHAMEKQDGTAIQIKSEYNKLESSAEVQMDSGSESFSYEKNKQQPDQYEQLTIAESSGAYHADFIKEAKRRNYTIIGQLFRTYWLVQVENELFIIDQHAAHEKVLYEKMMAQLAEKDFSSQQISPPAIVTMTMQEEELFRKYQEQFTRIGFEVEPFGGKEYAICAVPADLYNLNQKQLFLDMLDGLSQDTGRDTPDIILEKIASMSCKAAVKGNQHLTGDEAKRLLAELLELENPYNCPHGRPTIIAMSKADIERKFKRIV